MRTYRDLFPEELKEKLPRAFDVVGDICIIKMPEALLPIKKDVGMAILKAYRHIKVVCLDRGVKGEQRIRDLEWITGEKRTETEHRENGCRYRIDLSAVYFSPRLAGERARVSSLVNENEVVLDMFCGAGPFAIPAAKMAREVFAVDINERAVDFLKENMRLNRIMNIVPLCGDARDSFAGMRFDRVIMNLPHSSMSFLNVGLERCKEKATIHLYWMCEDPEAVEEEIARRAGRPVDIETIQLHGYSSKENLFCFDISVEG